MRQKLPLFLAVATFLICVGSANAITTTFSAAMSGAAEDPPIISLGTGTAIVTYDDSLKTLRVQVNFSGLTGTTTVAHIHAATAEAGSGTAGVATQLPTFAGFPTGVTSGTYDNTFNLTLTGSYNPSYVTANVGTVAGAEAALAAALFGGTAYLNIHTTFAPGGEIRGFLTQVPDSGATVALLGLSLAGLAFVRRRFA